MRDTGKNGFVLPSDQIIPSGIETFAAVESMANDMIQIYNLDVQPEPVPPQVGNEPEPVVGNEPTNQESGNNPPIPETKPAPPIQESGNNPPIPETKPASDA